MRNIAGRRRPLSARSVIDGQCGKLAPAFSSVDRDLARSFAIRRQSDPGRDAVGDDEVLHDFLPGVAIGGCEDQGVPRYDHLRVGQEDTLGAVFDYAFADLDFTAEFDR